MSSSTHRRSFQLGNPLNLRRNVIPTGGSPTKLKSPTATSNRRILDVLLTPSSSQKKQEVETTPGGRRKQGRRFSASPSSSGSATTPARKASLLTLFGTGASPLIRKTTRQQPATTATRSSSLRGERTCFGSMRNSIGGSVSVLPKYVPTNSSPAARSTTKGSRGSSSIAMTAEEQLLQEDFQASFVAPLGGFDLSKERKSKEATTQTDRGTPPRGTKNTRGREAPARRGLSRESSWCGISTSMHQTSKSKYSNPSDDDENDEDEDSIYEEELAKGESKMDDEKKTPEEEARRQELRRMSSWCNLAFDPDDIDKKNKIDA